MIKATVDESAISLEVKGSVAQILTDLSFIISGLYEGIPAHHRETFRKMLTYAVNDDNGPVWRIDE